jgi:hypothetical protein
MCVCYKWIFSCYKCVPLLLSVLVTHVACFVFSHCMHRVAHFNVVANGDLLHKDFFLLHDHIFNVAINLG